MDACDLDDLAAAVPSHNEDMPAVSGNPKYVTDLGLFSADDAIERLHLRFQLREVNL
jgi:hypothetical protein